MRIVLLLAPTLLAAADPATPPDGPSATITYAPDRVRLGADQEAKIDLLIDFAPGQSLPTCDPSQPLTFAGYMIAFSFDPSRLEFLGGAACPDAPADFRRFNVTSPGYANEKGGGGVIATNVGVLPTAHACYASVRFRSRPGASGSSLVRFGRNAVVGPTILATGIACDHSNPEGGIYEIRHNDGDVALELGVPLGDPALGDLNHDARVDVLDSVTLESCLVGSTKTGATPFVAGPSAADLNGDRTLDVLDLVALVARIVQGPPLAP